MGLRVIGAGLPRTGTRSLKAALERLLGGRCYHMQDVFSNLDHVPTWRRALAGEPPDWNGFPAGYVATVDWPASAFWPDLLAAHPDALVILSVREQPGTWWRSADRTILPGARGEAPADLREWQTMFRDLLVRHIDPQWNDTDNVPPLWSYPQWREEYAADAAAADAAYERHNAAVRAAVPAGRLLEWRASQGWEPLARALGLAAPDEPFPHYAGVHPRVAPAH